MGIDVLRGRAFGAADDERAPLVVIVNETMANRYWPGTSPVGRRVRLGGEGEQWREVVGIVRDVRHWGLDRAVNPEMYFPQRQMPSSGMTFVISSATDSASPGSAVREQIRAIDENLPLRIRTMRDVAAQSIASRRVTMMLLAVFGAVALLLAAAGLYGVMAHLVALRTAEIGIRMTLGAAPRHVLGLVVREGLLQTIVGLAVGLTGAAILMRSFATLLYGVRPTDPLTLAGVALVLLLTSVLACLVPARRAMQVNPIVALRRE